jgi:signal peptidase II
VLIADQALKFYIKTSFTIGQKAPFLPGVLELQFIENDGMAFGWALPGDAGKLALRIFRVLAAIAIGWYLVHAAKSGAHRGFLRSISLIWAGAVGNILDSVFYGRLFSRSGWEEAASFLPAEGGYAFWFMGDVVDMFHFTVDWPLWWPIASWQGREIFPPIWNIADAAISCAVIWILFNQKRYFGGDKA